MKKEHEKSDNKVDCNVDWIKNLSEQEKKFIIDDIVESFEKMPKLLLKLLLMQLDNEVIIEIMCNIMTSNDVLDILRKDGIDFTSKNAKIIVIKLNEYQKKKSESNDK